MAPDSLERLQKGLDPNILSFRRGSGPEESRSATNVQSELSQGEALLKSGDNDGAIRAFQQALAEGSYSGRALRRLAEAYTAKGQTDQALATFVPCSTSPQDNV